MTRTPLTSSSLLAVSYDPQTEELDVEFHNGRTYRYSQVPPQVHSWLLRTARKGAFLNRMIRDRYPWRDITAGSSQDLEGALLRSLERDNPTG